MKLLPIGSTFDKVCYPSPEGMSFPETITRLRFRVKGYVERDIGFPYGIQTLCDVEIVFRDTWSPQSGEPEPEWVIAATTPGYYNPDVPYRLHIAP